jgi:hypothetical protein
VDALVALHPWTGYLVTVIVLAAAALGAARMRSAETFSRGPFVVAAVAMDLQVTLGIVVYLAVGASGGSPALAVVHPLLGLLALGAGHGGVGAARSRPDARGAYRVAAIGMAAALVLLLAGIGVASAA